MKQISGRGKGCEKSPVLTIHAPCRMSEIQAFRQAVWKGQVLFSQPFFVTIRNAGYNGWSVSL